MLKFIACTPLQASMLSDFQGSPKCAQKRQRHHADPHRTVQALRAHELTSLLRSLPFPHPRKLPVIFASIGPCPSRPLQRNPASLSSLLGNKIGVGEAKELWTATSQPAAVSRSQLLPSWYKPDPDQSYSPYLHLGMDHHPKSI